MTEIKIRNYLGYGNDSFFLEPLNKPIGVPNISDKTHVKPAIL